MGAIYVGDVAPKGYFLDLSPDETDRVAFNFTQVTAATFVVFRPDRVEVEWPATITSRTTNAIGLEHLFAPGDLPRAGNYLIFARLETSDGPITSEPRTLPVRHRFATSP